MGTFFGYIIVTSLPIEVFSYWIDVLIKGIINIAQNPNLCLRWIRCIFGVILIWNELSLLLLNLWEERRIHAICQAWVWRMLVRLNNQGLYVLWEFWLLSKGESDDRRLLEVWGLACSLRLRRLQTIVFFRHGVWFNSKLEKSLPCLISHERRCDIFVCDLGWHLLHFRINNGAGNIWVGHRGDSMHCCVVRRS